MSARRIAGAGVGREVLHFVGTREVGPRAEPKLELGVDFVGPAGLRRRGDDAVAAALGAEAQMGRLADANLAVRGLVGDVNVDRGARLDRLEVDRVGEAPDALFLGEFGRLAGVVPQGDQQRAQAPGRRPPRCNSRRGNSWEYFWDPRPNRLGPGRSRGDPRGRAWSCGAADKCSVAESRAERLNLPIPSCRLCFIIVLRSILSCRGRPSRSSPNCPSPHKRYNR